MVFRCIDNYIDDDITLVENEGRAQKRPWDPVLEHTVMSLMDSEGESHKGGGPGVCHPHNQKDRGFPHTGSVKQPKALKTFLD